MTLIEAYVIHHAGCWHLALATGAIEKLNDGIVPPQLKGIAYRAMVLKEEKLIIIGGPVGGVELLSIVTELLRSEGTDRSYIN